jgi:hypothetical protein
LFYFQVGSDTSPLSSGVFLLPPVIQAFLLLVAGQVLPLLPSLASLFIYSSMRDCHSPLFFGTQGPPPTLLLVFFIVVVYYLVCFFLCFPWVGVVLCRGLC